MHSLLNSQTLPVIGLAITKTIGPYSFAQRTSDMVSISQGPSPWNKKREGLSTNYLFIPLR